MKLRFLKKQSSRLKDFLKREWHTQDILLYDKDPGWKVDNHTFILEEKNDIIAALSMKTEAGVTYIGNIIVSPLFRGKGIGKKLMQTAEAKARELDSHKIFLYTGKKWDSLPFYESLGYTVLTTLTNHYLHQDFVLMTKELE
jgi:N-acetylglutamate synthase-like GNAT family acetyltransferase